MTKVLLGLAFCLSSASIWASGPELEEARKLYNLTEYQKSLKVLHAIAEKDASVYEWIGRNYYMEGDYKKSTEALEKALAAEPSSSEIALWLGRAFGRRAETSSPFTAPGNASRARQYFEKSVALDPRNLEALNDLLEYYLEAPGFLGGGFEKAVAVAKQISALDTAEGHFAQAKLAEKRKEFASAEQQLRRAADLAPQQVGRILDLARFFAKQGRYQEADQSLQRAETVAPNSPTILYVKAEMYIRSGRNLHAAKALLKQYLSASLTPDDPPRSEAQKLLRQVEGS